MAAPVLGLEDMGIHRGLGWLFRGLSVFIGERDRLALVGRNGAGKSTLMQLISGQLEADEGRRTVRPGLAIARVDQDPWFGGFERLGDFVLADGGPAAHEAATLADEVGLNLDGACATASGGERRRAALVRALAGDPDLILLDEPTNHLDLAAIDWLEGRLAAYRGAFIAISHDRTFLSRLTRSTLWLERGALRRAEVGFGGFDAWSEQVYAEEERQAEKLDAKLAQELHWLARGVTARRRRNQGRLRRLEDMRTQRRAMLGQGGSATMAVEEARKSGRIVIDADRVAKSYGDKVILKSLSILIQRGDRIGLIGPNGVGKTTILNLLTGAQAPDSGTVKLGAKLEIVVIDQQRSALTPGKTVRQLLADGGDWVEVRGHRKHVAGYLKDFLFDPKLLDTKIEALSGGEQSRLLMARQFSRPSNLLVLDEPTNDLDLDTLDLLQETIADYDGTVLIVSHDRDFLDRSVTMVIGLDGSGRADVVAGGYSDWLAKAAPTRAPAKQRPPGTRPGGAAKAGTADAEPAESAGLRAAPARLTYKDQRDLDLLPDRIAGLEREIAQIEEKLADPALFQRDPKAFETQSKRLAAARAELDTAEERWLHLAELAEQRAKP